jgi:hypothetical protein
LSDFGLCAENHNDSEQPEGSEPSREQDDGVDGHDSKTLYSGELSVPSTEGALIWVNKGGLFKIARRAGPVAVLHAGAAPLSSTSHGGGKRRVGIFSRSPLPPRIHKECKRRRFLKSEILRPVAAR